jgi:sugar lactone lactonase YvrE
LVLAALGTYWVAWDGRSPGSGSNRAVIPAVVPACGTGSALFGTPIAVTAGASPAAAEEVSFVWSSDGSPESPELVSHATIDPECRLWVLDQTGNRFLIFDLDGKLLETWGEPGTGDGQFDFGLGDLYFMSGIAFTADGGFYVSDGENQRVQQFDADRTFVRSWKASGSAQDGQGYFPGWILIGPDGNVYVSVYAVDEIIQVYSPSGEFIRAFGGGTAGPARLKRSGPMAFDSAGNLWTVDPSDRTAVKFSLTGEPLTRLELPEMGTLSMGLAIDSADRLHIVDFEDNTVSVFAPDGTLLYVWGTLGLSDGKFLNPFDIVFDGSGGVYITEAGSPRIQKFQIRP